MIRSIDWTCTGCSYEILDALAREDEVIPCPRCHTQLIQRWWGTRRRNAQWSDADAILVHVDPKTGDVRYPGQHNAKLKSGYEKRYLRSLPEINRFEREHKVLNQAMHYDRNGRDPSDSIVGSH